MKTRHALYKRAQIGPLTSDQARSQPLWAPRKKGQWAPPGHQIRLCMHALPLPSHHLFSYRDFPFIYKQHIGVLIGVHMGVREPKKAS